MPFLPLTHRLSRGRPSGGETYPLNGLIGRQPTGTPARYYFDQWKTDGIYQQMNDELNKLDRMNEAREALPSALCADSQSRSADAVVAGGYRYEEAAKPESKQGFVPVKGRWVVELVRRCGSITWTNFFQRIVKDYEHTVSSPESFLYLVNSSIILQRIDKQWST